MRRAILDSPPQTMIYVSCNPPTLARDIAELQQRFGVLSITPFDMFPQTAEIECAVHLQLRAEADSVGAKEMFDPDAQDSAADEL
jgi:hypothetical protein